MRNKNIKLWALACLISFVQQGYAIGFTLVRDTVCTNVAVKFKDTTTPPAGLSIISRFWTFNAGVTTSTVEDSVWHTYTSPGTISPSLTVTYSDGSTQSITKTPDILVVASPEARYSVDRPITCPGVPVTFTSSNITGGATLVGFQLDLADGSPSVLLNDAIPVPTSYTLIKTYNTIYTITDLNGCIDTAMIKVQILPSPTIEFEPVHLSCKDSVVTYENRSRNISSFATWDWLFFDSLSHPLPRSGTGVNYTYVWRKEGLQSVILTGRTFTGCVVSDTLLVNVDTTPVLVIQPNTDTTICFGESIQYLMRGSDTLFYDDFLWGTKISGDSNVLFTPKNTKTYTVYGKTKNCPRVGKEFKISVVQPIATNITLTPSNILRGGQSIIELNTSAVFDSIRWTPASTLKCPTCDSTGASPQVTTTYTARVYYSMFKYPCSTVDSAILLVDGVCSLDSLKIPSAFTPNGDLLNDDFYVKSYLLNNVINMDIYNRWGALVFSAANVAPNMKENGWNGKINNSGDDVPPGLYIYNIKAVCLNGQELNFQGEINLIR